MGLMTSILLVLSVLSVIAYPVFRRLQRHAFPIAALALGIVTVLFATQAPAVLGGETIIERLSWVPEMGLDLTLKLDVLSLMFALLVSGVGALVLLYCRDYFDDGEEGLSRFGSVFLGFATSMLGLVIADNIYLLFIFWEATSVFSFLLIAHAYRQRTSRAAALQALMVTTFGGLAMLVGLVIMHAQTGHADLSAILAAPPSGVVATVAIYLVLLGALSKSAIFPFHFWLPGAMAAPTPVSAYLHAAAMVKAGIYVVIRVSSEFGDTPGYRETLVLLGAITMLSGGIRAFRQFDIKLIIAHSTVSQLGLMVMVLGLAEPGLEFAGIVLVFAHAVAKAPLFLIVGIVDHRTGTRDLRRLSGLGKREPMLAVIAILASASMAGIIPFFGFVAKESAFSELMAGGGEQPLALVALSLLALGSMLTVAYTVRFLWGTFATKPGAEAAVSSHRDAGTILIAPALFALLALCGGIASPLIDPWVRSAVNLAGAATIPEHLAVWHGFTPALGLSAAVIVIGLIVGWLVIRRSDPLPSVPERWTASHAYWLITYWTDVLAIRITAVLQRGSLPFYLSVILAVVVAGLGGTLIRNQTWPAEFDFVTSPVQASIGVVMAAAAIYALRARTRFQAVILVGVTGYGLATIFALHGAPDLALTQALVETVTLIAFVLVIRRLPQYIKIRKRGALKRWIRAALGIGTGLVLGTVALIAMGARVADPVSLMHPELAYGGGHGSNVVNVTLVDIRGWDTLLELSVVLAAATGVASLVFIRTRIDSLQKISRREARSRINDYLKRVADPDDPAQRRTWLLAGRNLDPSRRSIILEVVVRLVFHALILLSFYLLLTGHNTPGGGFAGGLVAGLALVARYLAGGRDELGATVPIDAGRILGAGLGLAALTAIVPLAFGQSALASAWVDLDLGPFGSLPLVTSTLFDIGVYLVVFGLILDVLRSLGAEVDLQEESDERSSVVPSGEETGEVVRP